MKKTCMTLAIALACTGFAATRAAAQGPAGVGAGAATASEQKSEKSHSYNPIKWIKKDPKKNTDGINEDQGRKLTARLQEKGVVADNADVRGLCSEFRELSACLAALHVSHNLGLNFVCTKANMTGIRAGADAASCKFPNDDKPLSLNKTIKLMKPDADAKSATRDAEEMAKEDLKATE